MQQPPVSLLYNPQYFNQEGSHWSQEQAKGAQYVAAQQWENSPGYHVNPSYPLPGQVPAGGGGQNRGVPVGQPPQTQSNQQPTPTSTPPGGMHGDMSKQALMHNQQQGQLSFVPTRSNMQYAPQYQRTAMNPQTQIRSQGGNRVFMPHTTMLPQPPTVVQVPVNYSSIPMYSQRQGTPTFQQVIYSNPPTPIFPTGQQFYAAQQVLQQGQFPGMPSGGGPSPQGGVQQSPSQIMRPPVPTMPPAKHEPKKRPNAIKIIDPNTNEEVNVAESAGNNNNITPTRSNDSSARETPQPNSGVSLADNTVAAEFAAKVARVATDPQVPSPSPDDVEDIVSSDSDVHHKQQSNVVPSSEKSYTLSTTSEEFIPRSLKPVCEPVEEQRIQQHVVPNVSADTNSPDIEIQRPKEQFPALKAVPTPVAQSPPKVNAKKQKGAENNERQQQAINAPPPAQAPAPPVVDNKDVTSKKGNKMAYKEESVPLPPKDKREKTRAVSKEQSPVPSATAVPVVSSQSEVPPLPPMKHSAPPTPIVTPVKDVAKSSVPAAPISASAEEIPLPPGKPQQQNGELPLPEPPVASVDGNKPTRGKKGKSNKRDLNRKGAEKEGSDMEAFTTDPIVHEDKERPSTPISPPLAPVAMKASVPPFTPAEPSHEDKIQEDLEEKEDKLLVEARNEENAKVSALTKAEEEPPPIIKKAVPQLTLKRSYKKDQWSPLNQEGKKKYDRDFLLDIKNEPQSQLKPENLPDVVAVISESNVPRSMNMNFMINSRDNMNMIMPPFSRNSQSQRGPMINKRGSQQGNKVNKNPKVIHMSLSLNEDVKLKTVENAWKPVRLVNDTEKTDEDKETEEVYKNVRGILNKLTPQKFDILMNQFLQIPINSEKRLVGVIDLVFEKAVDEPNFSKAYANMCKVCSKVEVNKEVNGNVEKVNFRKLLIIKCQQEFERNSLDVLISDQEEINNCTNPEKKKELQLAYDDKERLIRRKSVGNIRFIGELFKLGMLTQSIMYRCIEHLLQDPQEESLECLCKLLTTIGRDLEFQPNKQPNLQLLNPFFVTMNNLASKKDGSKVSSRVRFMLQDVIDLRANKWIPRREDNNPKTIEQINKEAERESMEMTMSLNQQPPRMNRGNDRQDDQRKRGGRANNNNQNEDGWNTVGGSRGGNFHSKFNQPSFDASRISMKTDAGDITNMNLGGSSAYRFFPGNAGSKNLDNKGANYSSMNVFSALSKVDDRKPSQPPAGRRLNHTPSMEKERMRMMQGLDGDRPSSRGSSVHRDRPSSQPPSRDSSLPRHQDNKDADNLKPKVDDRRPADEKDDMSEEKWERQVNSIFDEYLGNLCSIEDTKQEIEQLPRRKIGSLIEKVILISIEKKLGAQRKLGELINVLMESNIVSPDLLVEQLRNTYEFADDIAIDVPKMWEHQAFIIVPILAAEKINLSHIKCACEPVLKTNTATKLLVPILTTLAQEKGEPFVRRAWDSSKVSLQDFLPSNVDVDAFIKERSLEYLTGDIPISMDQVQQDLLKFIKENQPYETIFDFISGNIGEKVKDLKFIRALITAICEACISDSKSLEAMKLKPYEKLIQRYVDNNEDRELESLYAVHFLVSRLEHPQGLLMSIFNLFHDNNLISSESFLKWRDDKLMLENKGISVKSLRPFFTALEEAESDDEPS